MQVFGRLPDTTNRLMELHIVQMEAELLRLVELDNSAKIWDANAGSIIRTLIGHTEAVNGVAYSPDGYRIATVSSDGTAKIWDIDVASLQEDVWTLYSPLSHLLQKHKMLI